MAQTGWSYLVTHLVRLDRPGPGGNPESLMVFATDDGGLFEDEQSMLNELGATGWELFLVREHPDGPRHYFRRPRA